MGTKEDKYRRSKKGVITKIYGSQVSNSKRRGHSLPEYTKAWFSDWLFNNPEFHIIYDFWVLNNYNSDFEQQKNYL